MSRPPTATVLPTQRLSPKHQLTLSRDLRAFVSTGDIAYVRGIQHGLAAADGRTFPVILLLTEDELRRREDRILADSTLDGATRLALITRLNGGAARMAVDGQHRIVLPGHFMAYLGVDRDIFVNDTNTTVQLWNPEHYVAWCGRTAGGVVIDPQLTTYLAI